MGTDLSKKNYESFCKYRSEYKIDLGCKGVGRFVFLKVFKNINYKSRVIKEQKEKQFVFDFDFDTKNIKISKAEVKEQCTEILLSEPTLLYLYPIKGIDRRIDMDIAAVREKALLHLIPTLFSIKEKQDY